MFGQMMGEEAVVEGGSFQLLHIFSVALVDCRDESECGGAYHVVDVLLQAEELSGILNGEAFTACNDPTGIVEYTFGCAGGDWWVWFVSQVEGSEELGRGLVIW